MLYHRFVVAPSRRILNRGGGHRRHSWTLLVPTAVAALSFLACAHTSDAKVNGCQDIRTARDFWAAGAATAASAAGLTAGAPELVRADADAQRHTTLALVSISSGLFAVLAGAFAGSAQVAYADQHCKARIDTYYQKE